MVVFSPVSFQVLEATICPVTFVLLIWKKRLSLVQVTANHHVVQGLVVIPRSDRRSFCMAAFRWSNFSAKKFFHTHV